MIFVIASKLIGLRLWCKSRGGGGYTRFYDEREPTKSTQGDIDCVSRLVL